MTEPKTCDKFCYDCWYYRMIFHDLKYCSYFFDTGKRRPCPAGTGCTVKVKRKKKAKGEWNEKDELKPLVCLSCGGHIDRSTMCCPYCGTQYEKKHNDMPINFVAWNRRAEDGK